MLPSLSVPEPVSVNGVLFGMVLVPRAGAVTVGLWLVVVIAVPWLVLGPPLT